LKRTEMGVDVHCTLALACTNMYFRRRVSKESTFIYCSCSVVFSNLAATAWKFAQGGPPVACKHA
jgi:hypothetical protein